MAYEAGEESAESNEEDLSLFQRLCSWVKEDRRELLPWYKEARKDYGFKSGGDDQWEQDDINALDEQGRPHATFNFIGPSVNSVAGMEVSNRQEVTYLPRTTQTGGAEANPGMGNPGGMGAAVPAEVPGANDQGPAELYTAAGQYFRDQCDAEDEESDSFQDCATCGVGATDSYIGFEEDPAGKMVVDRIDPLDFGWDHRSSKRNMVDSRRFHIVKEMDKRAALDMFPEYDIEEIDACWAKPQNIETAEHLADKEFAYNQGSQKAEAKNTCRVVFITWFEKETAFNVADLESGEVLKGQTKAQVKTLRQRAKQLGMKLAVSTETKKVYKQAFLGNETILIPGDDKSADDVKGTLCQSQKGFRLNAITGTRDRNKKQWVGIVRAMRDPQRWTNALYSSVLHIIMTSGKGVMAERSAFENSKQADESWANASKITWLKEGALSGQNPKIVQKTPHNLPPAVFELMQFGMQALRDVSGVNVETLGAADTDQAAALDRQRKQAALLSLAPFFDGLRRYRKEQGRVQLDLIKNFLSDGRLIRIAGPDYEKYVPLIRDDEVTEFDIIVSESPTSPNQKEASWEITQALLPVIGKNTGPNAAAALLKASPLPEPVVKEFKEAAQKDAEAAAQQPNPEMLKIQADVQMKQLDAQNTQRKAEQDMALAQQKAGADMQLKQMEIRLKEIEVQIAQFQAGIDLQTARLDAEMKTHEMGFKQKEMEGKSKESEVQRAHDMQMRKMELGGQVDTEMAKNPEVMGSLTSNISKGLEALGKGIAEGMSAQAQAIGELAKATTAERRTELIWRDGMPVASESRAVQ